MCSGFADCFYIPLKTLRLNFPNFSNFPNFKTCESRVCATKSVVDEKKNVTRNTKAEVCDLFSESCLKNKHYLCTVETNNIYL